MNVSRVVLGTVIAALAVVGATSLAGCQVQASVKTKNRFVEPNITATDTADWAGQKITINIQGVGVSVNGGVKVTASASATKVTATARFLAMAFEEEKPNADMSIVEAKQTFAITNTASEITVACGHGGSHGSSDSGSSGCELTEITIPAGSETQPLELTVLGGNGGIDLNLSGAYIKNLGSNSNGGDIVAKLPASKGGSISLVTEKSDDITMNMPSSWAADSVTLQADADKITNAFSDLTTYDGSQGRGQAGSGLASLKATSKSFAGSTGKIILQ